MGYGWGGGAYSAPPSPIVYGSGISPIAERVKYIEKKVSVYEKFLSVLPPSVYEFDSFWFRNKVTDLSLTLKKNVEAKIYLIHSQYLKLTFSNFPNNTKHTYKKKR